MPTLMPTDTAHPNPAAWLRDYRFGLRVVEQGAVVAVGDGIAWLKGLPSAAMEELVLLEDGSQALVFRLTADLIGAILLRQTEQLTAGTAGTITGEVLSLPVGDGLLGRVIDPLGTPLDGGQPVEAKLRRPLNGPAPPIVDRDAVHRPLYTGNKVVDTVIPIAKGQRQLVIGDSATGKTSFALDTVLNQRGRDVRCVYVLIGQKRSSVVNTIETLTQHGAMAYSTVVVAEATALPGFQYLAPFAGCAVAEEWMRLGHDTLVIYDDLTTHAQTYRELSLLLRRPPGREAYPGDIFFLHAHLLERSTCLAANLGGGSMTALPIVETYEGELAAYIPTNLISITDGQIYLDKHLAAAGRFPAIDVTRSVSRIGGKGQDPLIKDKAGRMKLEYLQFLELEIFTRFGTRLERSVERHIARGRLLRTIFAQERLALCPIEFDMAWLTAFTEGWLDDVPLDRIPVRLAFLEQKVSEGGLTLADGDDRWRTAVRAWLHEAER